MAFFNLNKPKYVRIVVAGKFKTGKTTLVLKLSESELFGPLGLLDFEGGTIFYDDLVADNGSEVVPADNLIEINALADKLVKVAKSGKFPFKTIALDSLTTLWTRHWMVYGASKQRDSSAEADLFKEKQKAMHDWAKIKEIYHRLLLKFLSLPCHIIFVGWESEVIDTKNMEPTGELKAKIEKNTDYFVDCTLRIDVDKSGKRIFQVDYSRTDAIKTGDPATVESLEKIITALKGKPRLPKAVDSIEPAPEPVVEQNDTVCSSCGCTVNKAISIASKKQCGEVRCLTCMKK